MATLGRKDTLNSEADVAIILQRRELESIDTQTPQGSPQN